MRIAWFAPRPHPDVDEVDSLDDTPGLVAALGPRHIVEQIDARAAHDFVWRHARDPFDVCVYDLADTPDHAFLWPYLIHYPGVLRLRSLSLYRSRAATLQRLRRMNDYTAEAAFSGRRLLGAPVLASQMVVVADAEVAQALQDDYPHARIRTAPPGIAAPEWLPSLAQRRAARPPDAPTTFGMLDSARLDVAQRAAQRARDAGAAVALLHDMPPSRVLRETDVILALRWPPDGAPPTAALLGLSAGLPVVLIEEAVTAEWPTLDPQTWLPRDSPSTVPPIAVSIDPRDEEHSLMLAMRRLAADSALRSALGSAAYAWWRAHATPEDAASRWRAILDEAAALPRGRAWGLEPDGERLRRSWPAHLAADGGGRTRETLATFGITTDLLR